jgi:RND family efflux transporter MFP subunit
MHLRIAQILISMIACANLLVGCGRNNGESAAATDVSGKGTAPAKPAASAKKGPPATVVTLTKAEVRSIEITEETVGSLEDIVDPRISAEIAGRIVRILADVGARVRRGQLLAEIDPVDVVIQGRSDRADVARLEALLEQQERIVERNTKLVESNFISRNALDDATAQRNALREQLASAKAKVDATGSALRKTRVVSPIDGQVEELVVAPGDYVKLGDPMFRLVGVQKMRANLPFPESAAQRLKVGSAVTLTSPLVPGKEVKAKITDIRPTITPTSRAVNVIVAFDNDGSFRGGGTVNARVVTAVKSNIVVVPEQSVVLRPAGRVVYLFKEGRVVQQIVEIGLNKDGLVEIVKGLQGGETVALDGAGFLTNGAAVQVAGPRGQAKGGGKGPAKSEGSAAGASDGDGPAKAKPGSKS